jgi:methylmalonyl-CoA mutase
LISVDPSKRKQEERFWEIEYAINSPSFMRSLATRQSNLALSKYVADAIQVIKAAKYDIIILKLPVLVNQIRR